MIAKLIKSPSFALVVAGLFALAVGTHTNNGGFQLAGGMLCFIGVILWISKAGQSKQQD